MSGGSIRWKRRLVSAVLFLLACVSGSVGIGLLWEPCPGRAEADLVPVEGFGRDASRELPFRAFSLLDGYSDYRSGYMPEGFAEEAVSPEDLDCSEVHSSQGIVGMVCPGSPSLVAERLRGILESRGWDFAGTDAASGGMSFVKGSGRYRWLHFSCSEVSGSVSVWFAYAVAEE